VIDMLVLRCDFRDSLGFHLDGLGLPLQASITPQGEVHALRHAWEKIPSSHTDLAFKCFDMSELRGAFIELKASPAKIMQGQNVYGTDDLKVCALALIEAFFAVYPWVFELLDQTTWEVSQVDVTYASWAESEQQAKAFVRALSQVSKGQTKCRRGYETTAYFGKENSRLKKIKVYAKLPEVLAFIDETKRKGDPKDLLQHYPDELLTWAQGMIRWEVSLRQRWFERRGISIRLTHLVKTFNAQDHWLAATQDLRDALAGKDMKIIRDEDVLRELRTLYPLGRTGKPSTARADGAYRTYRAIRVDGWEEVKRTMADRTFRLHIEMLQACGLSRAHLQSFEAGAEVIPFLRYATVEFRNQFPDFAQKAA